MKQQEISHVATFQLPPPPEVVWTKDRLDKVDQAIRARASEAFNIRLKDKDEIENEHEPSDDYVEFEPINERPSEDLINKCRKVATGGVTFHLSIHACVEIGLAKAWKLKSPIRRIMVFGTHNTIQGGQDVLFSYVLGALVQRIRAKFKYYNRPHVVGFVTDLEPHEKYFMDSIAWVEPKDWGMTNPLEFFQHKTLDILNLIDNETLIICLGTENPWRALIGDALTLRMVQPVGIICYPLDKQDDDRMNRDRDATTLKRVIEQYRYQRWDWHRNHLPFRISPGVVFPGIGPLTVYARDW